ncbi:MAG TPA: hypothetical protein VFF94_09160, partial [Novosphingobium sp.]|nr:hypothetical protein [Novosphingobium sp.]
MVGIERLLPASNLRSHRERYKSTRVIGEEMMLKGKKAVFGLLMGASALVSPQVVWAKGSAAHKHVAAKPTAREAALLARIEKLEAEMADM